MNHNINGYPYGFQTSSSDIYTFDDRGISQCLCLSYGPNKGKWQRKSHIIFLTEDDLFSNPTIIKSDEWFVLYASIGGGSRRLRLEYAANHTPLPRPYGVVNISLLVYNKDSGDKRTDRAIRGITGSPFPEVGLFPVESARVDNRSESQQLVCIGTKITKVFLDLKELVDATLSASINHHRQLQHQNGV